MSEETADNGYSMKDKRWSRCPKCNNTKVEFTSKKGRIYNACWDCKLWLKWDGSTEQMATTPPEKK
jgi:hypothetical protein